MSFLEFIQRQSLGEVEEPHGKIIKGVARAVVHEEHQPKISLSNRAEVGTLNIAGVDIFGVFNAKPDSDASAWYEVSTDSDGDPKIDIPFTEDMLDDIKLWVKINDEKLKRVPTDCAVLDNDGDVRITLTHGVACDKEHLVEHECPTPSMLIDLIQVHNDLDTSNFKVMEGKFHFIESRGWFWCTKAKWLPIRLPRDSSLTGNFFASFK